VAPGSVAWATQTYATNPAANALRWGTMYNYWFDSDLPPDPAGAITVGLFRAPTASSPAVSFDVVGAVPRHCKADFNGDCALTVADFGAFQTAFVAGEPRADFNGDGQLTVADFGAYQTGFVAGCQ
jgi:glycosylphosphatidylinositol phospholipase D